MSGQPAIFGLTSSAQLLPNHQTVPALDKELNMLHELQILHQVGRKQRVNVKKVNVINRIKLM